MFNYNCEKTKITQLVPKFKSLICDKTQKLNFVNSNINKTEKLKVGQNWKTKFLTNLMNSNGDETHLPWALLTGKKYMWQTCAFTEAGSDDDDNVASVLP